jgi:altronate hydrolase
MNDFNNLPIRKERKMSKSTALTIRLHAADNVVVAREEIAAGSRISEENITSRDRIPFGHKVATADVQPDAPVRKFGHVIGFASRLIRAGEHVHTHNVVLKDLQLDYAVGSEANTAWTDDGAQETFDGILRDDGQVATRNYLGVVSTVNCSASAARMIADAFQGEEALTGFPNVDGVVALCHGLGCAMADKGEGFEMLQRTFTGYARHPNFAGVLFIGLGCEVMQIEPLMKNNDLTEGPFLKTMTIQESGGTRAAVSEGIARIREMLPEANHVRRRPIPVSRLIVGLECGGSDAYSGITANPALGAAADLLVKQGGTVVLGETPEIYGAEHLLTRRAAGADVARKLLERIRWWETYTSRHGGQMDNNPSPGNKAGGLTTIFEKSLGAAAKGGTTRLNEVYEYAQPVTAKGLVFMDTPGYDPASVTGMVAGGANIVCFTTGRGSVFGCKPVPSIKLATTTALYRRMEDDMDINCGEALDGNTTLKELGKRIFELLIRTASGRQTKSEQLSLGDNEFVPWHIGAVM